MDFLVGHCPDRFHGSRVERESKISFLSQLRLQARAENSPNALSNLWRTNES